MTVLIWIVTSVVGVGAGLLVCGFVIEIFASFLDGRRHPAPGTMIDVGGHRLHLLCAGRGEPTVVIVPGGGCAALLWEPVQRELANIATVCSYDRAGLGWSESAREPRRLEREATELHTLLAKAGIMPPYVLVGHSYGGLLSRIFARDYRNEVSGLVLVDSTEEHFITRPEFLAIWRIARLPVRRRALAAVFGLMRLWLLWWPSEASLPGGFSATAGASYRAFLCGRKHWWATLDEVGSLFEPDERTFLSQCGSFGRLDGLPTTVISAGLPVPRNAPQFQVPGVMSPDEFDRLHHESQERLAKLLSNSELIVAEKSGHMINFDQPSLVIEAIRHIVIAARGEITEQPIRNR